MEPQDEKSPAKPQNEPSWYYSRVQGKDLESGTPARWIQLSKTSQHDIPKNSDLHKKAVCSLWNCGGQGGRWGVKNTVFVCQDRWGTNHGTEQAELRHLTTMWRLWGRLA